MSFLKRVLLLIPITLICVVFYFGGLKILDNHRKIKQSPQHTATIEDIIDIKRGEGKYLVVLTSIGEHRYETVEAVSHSYLDVYEIDEEVTISVQPEKNLIVDNRNYLLPFAFGFILLGFLVLMIFYIFSTKIKIEKSKVGSIFFGFSLIGFGLVISTSSHYKLKERAAYLSNSEQTTGTITGFHEKICKSGSKRNRKKYPCFSRIVSYSPLGSFDEFTIQDKIYKKDIEHAIGTPVEVVYLKSNGASARILDTLDGSKVSYFFMFFGGFLMAGGVYCFRRSFREFSLTNSQKE